MLRRYILRAEGDSTEGVPALKPPFFGYESLLALEMLVSLCAREDEQMVQRNNKELMLFTKCKSILKCLLAVGVKAEDEACVYADARIVDLLDESIPFAEPLSPLLVHLLKVIRLDRFKADKHHFAATFLHKVLALLLT